MDKLLRIKDENNEDSVPLREQGDILGYKASGSIEQDQEQENLTSDLTSDYVSARNSELSDFSPRETLFANLGAPRERYHDEYVPNAILEEVKKPIIKRKASHFRLMPSIMNFSGETSTITFAKYAVLTLFVGIAIASFLTQGVLVVKDIIFGPKSSDFAAVDQFSSTSGASKNKLLNSSSGNSNEKAEGINQMQGSGFEQLGSDDGSHNSIGGSALIVPGTNQYQLSNTTDTLKPTARAYLAADLQTGEVILEHNDDLVAPIASVSKLMTAIIAEENIDMQKIAIVSRDSYNTYGTQGELRLGEKIKVYDLMYPLLMESSNDAAEVLADSYDKGHDAFMSLMNKKATELGMANTYFEDPSGLSPKNVSSVQDLLKLGRYVFQKYPNLFSMTRVRQYAILKHTWFNQNRFLTYDTFIGGKNGYIDESKKTTVSLFDINMARGGKRQIVVVLLKSDDREGDAVKIINFLKKNANFQEVVESTPNTI